jgi:hypothetical protein
LLHTEALALQALGFKQQATYRLMTAKALGRRDPTNDDQIRNGLIEA